MGKSLAPAGQVIAGAPFWPATSLSLASAASPAASSTGAGAGIHCTLPRMRRPMSLSAMGDGSGMGLGGRGGRGGGSDRHYLAVGPEGEGWGGAGGIVGIEPGPEGRDGTETDLAEEGAVGGVAGDGEDEQRLVVDRGDDEPEAVGRD